MNITYQGHHQDGSGVQKHSAGQLYPYVVGVRERQLDGRFIRTRIVYGPRAPAAGFECPTVDEAVSYAETLINDSRAEQARLRNQAQWSGYQSSRNSK